MITRFRSVVGAKRITRTTGLSEAAWTSYARDSMQSVIKNFQALCKHMEVESTEVLLEALQPAFDLSQVYVPKLTGELKKSGYLQVFAFRGRPTVEIGYGKGGEPEYAAAVHENLRWRHKTPTQAKFLERALEETESEIQARIVDGYRKAGDF